MWEKVRSHGMAICFINGRHRSVTGQKVDAIHMNRLQSDFVSELAFIEVRSARGSCVLATISLLVTYKKQEPSDLKTHTLARK